MGELWIVLAVSCGLAFLSEKYTFAWNGRPSKVLNYGIVVLLIAYLSLFAGLRTGYNDTYTYMSGYKAMAAFPDILTEFSWRLGDNPGFILLNSLMKAAGYFFEAVFQQLYAVDFSFCLCARLLVFFGCYEAVHFNCHWACGNPVCAEP